MSLTNPLIERMRPHAATIFAEMTALATKYGAINLGQGFPEWDGPPTMIQAAQRAIADGVNQYPPGPGRPELRQAIAEHQRRCYGLDVDADGGVLVTVGATEGIAACVLALAEPGDEVVLLEPYYDSYAAVCSLAGAVRRPVRLRLDGAAGRFAFDPDELRAAVTPRTRLVLLNNPHNPTGAVLTAEEMGAVAGVCCEHDLIAVTDEVYEHLTYDGIEHTPLATLPGMAERTLTVSSAAKTFAVTGWKTGWVTGPQSLVAAVTAVKQFLTFAAGAPFQVAVARALREDDDWVAGQRKRMEGNRDRLVDALAAAGFGVHRPQGTYFVQADLRPLGIEDAMSFARALPERAGVVAVPTSVFCDDPETGAGLLRFACAKREETLDEAVRRLSSLEP